MNKKQSRALAAMKAILARRGDAHEYPYPPGVNKDHYDAQTWLEGGREEAEAAADRMDARAMTDPVEMFTLENMGSGFRLNCKYGDCGYWMPFVAGTRVDKVCQELYSHAFTNHGVTSV